MVLRRRRPAACFSCCRSWPAGPAGATSKCCLPPVRLLVYTAFAGLGVALALLLAGRVDGARLKHYGRCLVDFRYDRQAGRAALPPKDSEQARVPFSFAIALGLLAVLWPF